MFLLYQLVVSIILIFSPLIIIFRILKKKEDNYRFIEKFSFHTKKRVKGKLIWFHGASVGEILSVIPLIQYYEKKKSINQILITSSTLSSSKVINKFKFNKTVHQFYPVDHFLFTNKFLQYWKPSLAMFIDSEIWPHMFKKINDKNIPLVLLNARITKKTFKRWIKIKQFSNSVFNKISVALPQNLETRIFLKKLSVKKINLIGNLKFAENRDENLSNINKSLRYELKKKKFMGSV